MRYWVYINDKVDGPYDENKLVTLGGFSQDTLICSEEVASKGGQEWVKASSIFEFDEVPVQDSAAPQQAAPVAQAASLDTSILLAKLESLTQGMSHLHEKLDSMQTHLDQALEQNKQLAEQAALQADAAAAPILPTTGEALVNTITLAPQEQTEETAQETPATADAEVETFPAQAAPKEEELIIRSALDSIYGEKPLEATPEETFQDLLPQKEIEAVEKISEELTFTPVEEEKEPTVKEALITTPSADEAAKDALISELTASPKEDILDQIIQEHQAEQVQEKTAEKESSSLPGLAAAGAAVAGLAGIAAAAVTTPKEETPAEPLSIATDKNDPSHVEEVLPAAEMPADVPVAEPIQEVAPGNTLPSLEEQPIAQPEMKEEKSVQETLPQVDEEPAPEDTLQELVPGAALKEEPAPLLEDPIAPADTAEHGLTEKDLEDAFGPMQEEQAATAPAQEMSNPNDLTEIELKEGSTYLISDFVPPAQLTDNVAAVMGQEQPADDNQKQETVFQDMLAVANKGEKTQVLSTEGLPEDAAATQVSLENTIQAKRGASLDIKTVPMVPEPADAQRLDMNDLDDVNAQHDIKTAKTPLGLTKIVIGALVGLLLLIILYVLLGLMHLLPASVNLFAGKNAVATDTISTTEEFFTEENAPAVNEQATPTESDQALSSVQNFPLPNGMTLQQWIAAKHPAISADLITWEIADAVEPDNYSVTVKVPPENPQNFKTVYRFNYNVQNGMLDPTISDAKNLLDQAYGQ